MKRLSTEAVIGLDTYKHEYQFVGMKNGNDKYIAVPYGNDRVAFANILGQTYYAAANSLKSLVESLSLEYKTMEFYVFDNGIEMAKWILK